MQHSDDWSDDYLAEAIQLAYQYRFKPLACLGLSDMSRLTIRYRVRMMLFDKCDVQKPSFRHKSLDSFFGHPVSNYMVACLESVAEPVI